MDSAATHLEFLVEEPSMERFLRVALPRMIPDHFGDWEAFERVMKKHGYFTTGLRKVEAAESIAAHINPDRNKSRSFSVFRRVLVEAIAP